MARLLLGLASVALMVALWDLVVRAGFFSTSVLPAPWRVARAGWAMYGEGTLVTDTVASLRRAAAGFTLGAVLAVLVGTLTASSRLASAMLEPTLRLLSPIPTIALVPLAVLWFGLGEQSKLFLVAAGVFFPVWIATHAGVASTPREYLKVCACLGAKRRQVVPRVVLPEALPDIVSGLRVGIATAFILIVASELSGTAEGLGYRLQQAQLFSQPDRLLFCLGLLGVLGAAADRLLFLSTRKAIAWASATN